MKKTIEVMPVVLLVFGTLGLLLNEYVFDWGRTATLSFAAVNVIGLLVLGYTLWMRGKDQ